MPMGVNPVCGQLEKLTVELRAADAARAAEIVHRAAEWLVLAGFGHEAHDAYQLLLTGPLRLSARSSLVHRVESVLPLLCFALRRPCPAMFTIPAASSDALERHVLEQEQRYLSQLLVDRYSIPHEDWDADLETRAIGDAQPPLDQRERSRFLRNAHRLAQQLIMRGDFASAKLLIAQYDKACVVARLPRHDWISLEMRTLAVAVNFMSEDSNAAILQQRALLSDLMEMNEFSNRALSVMAPLRSTLSALIEGAARDLLQITPSHVDALFEALHQRSSVQLSAPPTLQDWRRLMDDWNTRVFRMASERLDSYSRRHPEAYAARSGARAPATDSEIAALEKRLGTSLPPSFVSFLRYSNGYSLFDYPEVIFGTDEIEWFVTHNKEYADIWNEERGEVDDEMYAQYGAHQNPVHMRAEYLYSSLQISDVIDGYVYLLNPKIVNLNGDWEAWDFGSKIPGAIRYRSFWEMMCALSERIPDDVGR
jgi:hypothetical protein